MSRIVHLAIKCKDMEDLEKATTFYREIFGIYQTKQDYDRGHVSRHMTDGAIDLALMVYDSEEEKEAQLAGPGARIHHIGIEVDDRPSMIAKIESHGGKIFSDRAQGALKYRSPDGTMQEIVGVGRYLMKEPSQKGRIARVAIKVSDLDKATKFYEDVFGFRVASTTHSGGVNERKLTDGATELTLLRYDNEIAPGAALAGEGSCIHHWSLHVKDFAASAQKIEELGGRVLSRSATSVQFLAPDGNVAEIFA